MSKKRYVVRLTKWEWKDPSALIRSGKGHWRTWMLVKVTKGPGDEKKLMALADGPALPGYGHWTALSSLGVFDTKAVRAYLLERIAKERDAGLYMSAAQALGRLREPRAHEPVAKQLMAFEAGWSGVQGHLLGALYQINHDKLPAALEAFATDERATGESLVGAVLAQIHNLDPEAAKRAAKAVIASKRFAGFSPAWQAQIRKIAGE